MTARSRIWHARRALLILAAAAALVIAGLMGGGATPARAATEEPCDIYAAADTPCVAAHSTTRALYDAYDGPLYQVERASDGTTTDICLVSTGGVRQLGHAGLVLRGHYLLITEIFDQSGHGNNLTDAPAGGDDSGPDSLANAAAAPVRSTGTRPTGSTPAPASGTGTTPPLASRPATRRRASTTSSTARTSTTSAASTSATPRPTTTTTATAPWKPSTSATRRLGHGAGTGPWIMADLENGLYSGSNAGYNSGDPTIDYRFTTAMIEGEGEPVGDHRRQRAIGLACPPTSAGRALGLQPDDKQGAIMLGIGGDNSDGGAGTFYEGVMTSGYPTAATEDAVQANIVSADYTTYTLPNNPFTDGSYVSLNTTTPCCTGDYLTGDTSGDDVGIEAVTASSSTTVKEDATWIVEPGLANSSCVSFKSANGSGDYIRHYGFELYWNRMTAPRSSPWTRHSARGRATADPTSRSCPTTTAISTSAITTTSATSPATAFSAPTPGTPPISGMKTPPGSSPPRGADA